MSRLGGLRGGKREDEAALGLHGGGVHRGNRVGVDGAGHEHHEREHVRLVDRAHPVDAIEDVADAGDVRGEAVECRVAEPPAFFDEPPWAGEVVQGHDRGEAERDRRVDHASVVSQFSEGELPGEGLDAGPLDAEAVGGQACFGEEAHVLFVAVVAVDGVAAGAEVRHPLLVNPPVAVEVVAFDLVRRSGGSPQECRRGSGHRERPSISRVVVSCAVESAPTQMSIVVASCTTPRVAALQ